MSSDGHQAFISNENTNALFPPQPRRGDERERNVVVIDLATTRSSRCSRWKVDPTGIAFGAN